MPTIVIDKTSVLIDKNTTILNAALNKNLPHTHACGGKAQCSTCRIRITKGLKNCNPPNQKESVMKSTRNFPNQIRLACQTTITGDVSCQRLVKDEEDITLLAEEIATPHASVGEAKEITVFFSDLRGFTSFSERLPPYDVVHILNKYFNRVCPHIIENGGEIDKYMGDGIMAIFGCLEDHNPTLSAIKSSLQQLTALQQFNCHLQDNYGVTLKMGIGIHTGTAIVGNIGYRKKVQFSAIGDVVNMTARIESANKDAGTELLISEDAYSKVKDRIVLGKSVNLPLKGKTGTYKLFEVTGLID